MPKVESEASLRKQIAALQEKLKRSSRVRLEAIQAIVKEMRKHGIGTDELRAALGGKAGRAPDDAVSGERARTRAKPKVKYRDEHGNTWTGRGNSPRWLVAAEAAGRKREEFLV